MYLMHGMLGWQGATFSWKVVPANAGTSVGFGKKVGRYYWGRHALPMGSRCEGGVDIMVGGFHADVVSFSLRPNEG